MLSSTALFALGVRMRRTTEVLDQWNELVAIKATLAMSTVWTVYLFLGLSVLPLLVPSTMSAIQYISSAVLQLVALPLIMVGQNILGRASELRAAEDHQRLLEILKDIKQLHALPVDPEA